MIQTVGVFVAILVMVAAAAAMVWINGGGLIRGRAARGKPPAKALSARGRLVALGLAVLAIIIVVVLLAH